MEIRDKFTALNSLGECSVKLDMGEQFYCTSKGVEISNKSCLTTASGRGVTPNEAIEEYWKRLTTVKRPERIVIDAMTEKRREVLWTGYMWKDV